MCAELLEETENEELIHIMEGKVQTKKVQPGDQSLKNTSQSCLSTSSSSKSDAETRQKSHKKKRSKRRKKKRKKKRVSESESSEDDHPETGTGHEDDSSSENCTDNLDGIVDSTLSDVNKSKSRPSSGTSQSQQSLLELIQIEYKTKAINVMLKNLGVATEISSLVSNVLHTGGISAIQAVTANTDTSMQEEVKEKAESSETHHVHNVVPDMNSNVTEIDNSSDNSEKKCDTESDTEEEKTHGVSDNALENDTESQSEDCSSTSNCPTLTVTATPSKPENDVTLVEKEIFKEVLDDVLDIGVGDNDEIDFY